MNYEPKVSIITVCYNSEKTIKDTLQSVLHQSYTNIEYIIIDGKSTDGTLKIIKEYKSLFNGRMKYISEIDSGIYNAMNKGIAKSSGEIIGIINSDDFYEPDAVWNAVSIMNPFEYQVAYGALRLIRKNRSHEVIMNTHDKLPTTIIQHPTCFVTSITYQKHGLFNEKYKISSDHDLLLRYYLNGNVKFIKMDKIITNFRVGGASAGPLGYKEHCKLRYKHGTMGFKEYITNILFIC